MFLARIGLIGLAFVAFSGVTGCQKGPVIPEAIPVSGKVTYNGAPVVGAAITFVSIDPKGKNGGGSTNESGSFTITTYIDPTNILNGVVAGDYRITVANFTRPAGDTFGGGASEQSQSQFPTKYSQPETTDLTVTVAKGQLPIPLELKD